MERVPCCVCGSERSMRAWAYIAADDYARRVPEAPVRSRWVVCRGCGLVHQSPRPDAGELAQMYSGSGYRDWTEVPDRFLEYSRRRAQPMLQWLEGQPEFRRLTESPDGRATVVDIGCGVGGSVREFADRGWRAYGVEPDPMLARSGSERFGVTIAPAFMHDGLFPGLEFALGFSVHTFEHLLDPLAVARAARALLTRSERPGYLFIAVPTFAHASHPAWRWMNTSHTYLFSAASLGNLLHRAGFTVVRSLYPEPTYHPCSEPSELWMLARTAASAGDGPLPFRESPLRVQATLAAVPLRWTAAGALRRLRRGWRRLSGRPSPSGTAQAERS